MVPFGMPVVQPFKYVNFFSIESLLSELNFRFCLQKNSAGAQVLEFKLDVQASLIDEEEIGPFIFVGVLLGPHLMWQWVPRVSGILKLV